MRNNLSTKLFYGHYLNIKLNIIFIFSKKIRNVNLKEITKKSFDSVLSPKKISF